MPAPKRKRRTYTPTEVKAALTTLAFFGGNTAKTSVETGIAQQTLHDWRAKEHRDLYLEIADREAPKLEAIAAAQAREAILRSSTAEHLIFDRLERPDDLSSKELAELAGAYQRFSTGKGIQVTKLLELTGRPTSIIEHRDPRDEIRGLARELGITIESTAQEIRGEPRTLPGGLGSTNARDLVSVERSD